MYLFMFPNRVDDKNTFRDSPISVLFSIIWYTVKPLKTDTPRDEQKCPSYRGVRLIEVIFNRNLPLGHR